MIRTLKLAAIAAAVAGGLAAQTTNRTNVLTTVPQIGGTLTVTVKYPVLESGNPYAMFWSPKYPGTTNLNIPFIQGLLRLDPATFAQFYTGTFDPTGAVSTAIPVPVNPSLIGGSFDMQSADLNIGALTVYLADNDVTPYFNADDTAPRVRAEIAKVVPLALEEDVHRRLIGLPRRQRRHTLHHRVFRHRADCDRHVLERLHR